MSKQLHECARQFKWAGGNHVFNLAAPAVLRILSSNGMTAMPTALMMRERYFGNKCLAGQYGNTPAAAMKRFNEGVYSIDDVETIIELGLYGGGDVSAREAVELVDKHVHGRPIGPNAQLAFEILAALFVGTVKAA